jgi:hypothetical protein
MLKRPSKWSYTNIPAGAEQTGENRCLLLRQPLNITTIITLLPGQVKDKPYFFCDFLEVPVAKILVLEPLFFEIDNHL